LILSSTASEDKLVPVARSANIAWSRDVDEVFGTHRLVELLDGAGVESGRLGGKALATLARRHELISDETLTAIEGLSVLRNIAAHSPTDFGAARARDYLALADAVMYTLHPKGSARLSPAPPAGG
jgi:hypothetical protein